MARLTKSRLLATVEEAIRESGWALLRLSKTGVHPARYQVYRNGTAHRVRVYIWNMSHGGGAMRAKDEYRIQITGIETASGPQQFLPEADGKTLILGWWDQVSVFAGYDYAHHAATLGTSPSIQVKEAALHAAHANGFAPYNRGNGELVIAFRPDFMGTYIDNLEALHGCGESDADIGLLDEIAADPEGVDDDEIQHGATKKRRHAIVTTVRALREIDFRDRVLTAYGHRCAMCGVQLRLLDAAHVLPVAHSESTDETRNGVALCALHHRAYDRALVTFDEKFRIRCNAKMTTALKAAGHDGGLLGFTKNLRPVLILPPDKKDRPAPQFVKTANALRGW